MLFLCLRLRRLQPLLLLSPKTLIHPNYRLLSCSSSSTTSQNPNSTKTPEYWTEEVQYLDESDNLISTSVAARRSIPDIDTPPSPSAAASRISDAALRHGWGPDLHLHLSRLPFVPDPSHLSLAFSLLLHSSRSSPPPQPAVSAALSLLRWARLNLSFIPDDATLSLILSHLSTDPDSISHIFDEDVIKNPDSLPLSANLTIQLLCKASRIEIAFCCFKKLKDASFGKFDVRTYNSLIAMFLTKGLPYKAFEIYESCSDSVLDLGNYELMIPALAKSGRIDGALKLFDEMKRRSERPGVGVYSVLVDCMGKAGRLDAAVGVYREMQAVGYKPNGSMYVSMIESLIKSGKLDAGRSLWDEMKGLGFRPNFGLYTLMVEAHAKSGRLEVASGLFDEMEKSGFLPTPSTFSCLIEMHSAGGNVDCAMRLYNSMNNAGFRLGMSVYTSLLSVLANKKLLDLAAKILLEMKANGFSVDVNASDVLMIYIKDGSTDLALRWLRFMGSAGIRTNNFIIRQLFESCMKARFYDSAKPLLETYVGSAAKVDLILYTSILAHLIRCQDEKNERAIMDIMSATKHNAHVFMCGLFTGPEQRKKPVLSFVREFFQGIDYEVEESAARYFVNVLLNYLVLLGQMNRARCVWKVTYENKLFPKAIEFDQHIAWSLDVRNLSVGAALVAVVHTLHRFRKRMLYYGVVPRRIKLVTGSTLKMVVAQVLASVESPFEVSKVVLRAPGDLVLEWFKKPIVQQFLLNEIPSKSDVLMHKLNVMFPSSAPEVRLLSPPKPPSLSKVHFLLAQLQLVLIMVTPLMDSTYRGISSSVPHTLSSPIRVASVGNHNNVPAHGKNGHSFGQMKLEFQNVPVMHPHSLPEYHDGITNGIPYNSSPVASMAININSRPGEGIDNRYNPRVGFGSLTSHSFEGAFGGQGNGSCPVHGQQYIWNNPSGYHRRSAGPMILGNISPSSMNNIPAHHPLQMHGLPRAPSHMPNTVLPIHAHHVGSVPAVNPSIWERRQPYIGDSMDAPTFHPGSLGSMGFSHNIFPHSGGSCIDHVGIPSPQQRCHMFHGRNHIIPMPASFDAPIERIRSRRNDLNANQMDNKEQYDLDIDRIVLGEDARTTLMIKNIPNKYTSKMLMAAINEHHKGSYDFIYLPIDFKNKCNVGYAFINMIDSQQIIPFFQTFNGKKWEKFNSEKVASLAYARIQGTAAPIAHFQNSSLMNEDKRCRPIIFHSDGPNAGDQVDRIGKHILLKLMNDWRLMDELGVLRVIYLLGSGDLLQQFLVVIYDKMDKGDSWGDDFELNTLLQVCDMTECYINSNVTRGYTLILVCCVCKMHESIRNSADGTLLCAPDSLVVSVAKLNATDDEENTTSRKAINQSLGIDAFDMLNFTYKVS